MARFWLADLHMANMRSIFVFLTTVGTFHNLWAMTFKKTRCVHLSLPSIEQEIVAETKGIRYRWIFNVGVSDKCRQKFNKVIRFVETWLSHQDQPPDIIYFPLQRGRMDRLGDRRVTFSGILFASTSKPFIGRWIQIMSEEPVSAHSCSLIMLIKVLAEACSHSQYLDPFWMIK